MLVKVLSVVGAIVTAIEFFLSFRAWTVASPDEALGATIVFFCLGVMPWIGWGKTFIGQRSGALLLIGCGLVASIGFCFLKFDSFSERVIFASAAVLPTVILGGILLKLTKSSSS